MGDAAANIDLVHVMRRIRTAIAQGWQKKSDPRLVWARIEADINLATGVVGTVRQYAPALGEMWDTLIALAGHCQDLHDQTQSVLGVQSDAGLPSAVPADPPDTKPVAPFVGDAGAPDMVDPDD